MDYRAEILEELRNISPAVADIPKTNVYTNPLGYFDGLPEYILKRSNQSKQNVSINKITPYNIPSNYFESLSDQIVFKVKLSENATTTELATIAPIINSLGNKNVWQVPADYFSGLSDDLLKKIEVDQSVGGKQQLTSANIQAHTQEVSAELDLVAPILNNISKQSVFSVPESYFEKLDIKPATKTQGALVSMFSQASSFKKYAAAAVVGALLLTGSFLFLNKGSLENNVSNTASSGQIKEYTPEAIQALTDQEIKAYLSTNGTGYVAPLIWEENDLEELMHQMTEEEIRQYLKENSEPSDLQSKEG